MITPAGTLGSVITPTETTGSRPSAVPEAVGEFVDSTTAAVGDAEDGSAVVGDAEVGSAVVGDAEDGSAVVGDAEDGSAVVGDAVTGAKVVGDVDGLPVGSFVGTL